jgi:hypothetical protein
MPIAPTPDRARHEHRATDANRKVDKVLTQVRVRYRILSSSFDPAAFGQAFEANLTSSLPSVNLEGSLVEAAVGAPKKVNAAEGKAKLHEVCVLVERGQLKLRDLANAGRGWELVADCPELDEACERYRARRKARRLWLAAAVVVLVVAVGIYLAR